MRRIALVAAILITVAVPAAARGTVGHAYLRGFVCHRSLDPSKRVVSVTAVMGTIAGTQRLEMRFQLEERTASGVSEVRVGDLGRWVSPSQATLGQNPNDQWIFNHPVTGLPVPATYRFRVSFRWIGARGRTLGELQRSGINCRQPDMRPDLYVRLMSAYAVGGGNQYDLEVGNTGLSGARNVELRFTPGGSAAPQTKTIAKLTPHETVERSFVGPACKASSGPVTFTVDPNDLIDVLSRADNSITAPCNGS